LEAIMGGLGSGRPGGWGAKSTTNAYLAIDVRHWKRERLLTPGLTFRLYWKRNDAPIGAMEVEVEAERVVLIYQHQRPGGEGKNVRLPVDLEWTPCHLGGERPWFLCPEPACVRRVAILYAGPTFRCRHCLELTYCSQREGELDRKTRKLHKIRAQLGVHEPGEPILFKPKGMHYTTFERLREEERAARQAADAVWLRSAGRIFRRAK
jgi:hypothetical protein